MIIILKVGDIIKNLKNIKINKKEIIEWMVFLVVLFVVWSHVNVVVSDSMYPLMKRGDLVVVENANWEFNPKEVKVGDIVIYNAHWPDNQNKIHYILKVDNKTLIIYKGDKTKPVIHRVIDKLELGGKEYIITKGDNNPTYDPELTSINQIKQRAITINGNPIVIPYIGYMSIYLREYLWIILPLMIIYFIYDEIVKKKNKDKELNEKNKDKK